jgi:hypothetical protein
MGITQKNLVYKERFAGSLLLAQVCFPKLDLSSHACA